MQTNELTHVIIRLLIGKLLELLRQLIEDAVIKMRLYHIQVSAIGHPDHSERGERARKERWLENSLAGDSSYPFAYASSFWESRP
jgi:hypothetical protein